MANTPAATMSIPTPNVGLGGAAMTEKTRTARFSHTISSSAKRPMRSFFLIFSITSKRYSSGNTPKNVGTHETLSVRISLLRLLPPWCTDHWDHCRFGGHPTRRDLDCPRDNVVRE